MEDVKVCTKCHKSFPKTSEYFTNNCKSKDGYYTICKTCKNKSHAEYLAKNKELTKIYKQKNKEKICIQQKDYKIANANRLKIYHKEYYQKNKQRIMENRKGKEEQIKINKLKYITSEKGKNMRRSIINKRIAKSKNLEATFNSLQWEICKEFFNYRCAYCGKEEPLEQDHFIPLSRGGEYTVNNIIPACRRCNSSKNNKYFKEWYIKQSYYSKERFVKIYKYLGYYSDFQQLAIFN